MDPIELNDEMNLAPTSAGEPLAAGPGLTFRDCWYFLLFAASLALPNLIYRFGDDQLAALARSATPVATPVMTPVGKPSETLIDAVQRKVLVALKGGDVMSTSELAEKVGISQPKNMRRRYLRLLLDMGLVEYTIPQKPNSRLQKYRLTDKGRSALAASVH